MRSYRYSDILMKFKEIRQFPPVTSTVADTILAPSDDAISQVVEHKGDSFATEYWVFHKSIFDTLPQAVQDSFKLRVDWRNLRKADAPCWALTENNYIAYIPVITEVADKKGKIISSRPKAYFIKGQFAIHSKTKRPKLNFIALLKDDEETRYRNCRNPRKQSYINGDASKDPRVKNFIKSYLLTNDIEYAYVTAFHSGDLKNNVQKIIQNANALIKRKEVIELMDKEISTAFEVAMEKRGLAGVSIEEYIINKRLELVDRVLESDKDKLLPLADRALTGLETIVGMLTKNKVTYTQTDTINLSLSESDKAGLLDSGNKVEEAEVVSE